MFWSNIIEQGSEQATVTVLEIYSRPLMLNSNRDTNNALLPGHLSNFYYTRSACISVYTYSILEEMWECTLA